MTASQRAGRPLWQWMLGWLAIAFSLQPGTTLLVLTLGDGPPVLMACYALQLGLALATACGVWLGRGWAILTLVGLGAALVATSLVEGFYLGIRPAIAVAGRALLALLVTVGLAFFLQRGSFGHPGERRSS